MKRKAISILCLIVTGVVLSVEGNVISLLPMGNRNSGNENGDLPQRPTGEMPQRPDGEERGERPTGEMPQRPDGEERGERPTGEMPQRPDGGERGERPTGESAGGFRGFGADSSQAESYDLSAAHISVEIDEGKAAGSMEDLQQGSFVTLTLNAKGEVTNVLVSSRTVSFPNRGQNGQGRPNDKETENPAVQESPENSQDPIEQNLQPTA